MCIQWTRVLYSVVLTRQSNPPISQFSRRSNGFTSVWSIFPCNTIHIHCTTIEQRIHFKMIWMYIANWSVSTYIVMTGATRSRLAMRMPISEIARVSRRARNGSPRLVVTEKKLRTGITPSTAIACNSLGAPTKSISINGLIMDDCHKTASNLWSTVTQFVKQIHRNICFLFFTHCSSTENCWLTFIQKTNPTQTNQIWNLVNLINQLKD